MTWHYIQKTLNSPLNESETNKNNDCNVVTKETQKNQLILPNVKNEQENVIKFSASTHINIMLKHHVTKLQVKIWN